MRKPLSAATSVAMIADALGFTFYGPANFAGQLVGYLRTFGQTSAPRTITPYWVRKTAPSC